MRVLIVKSSALGDIVHALPVLDYLKQVSSGIEVDWVVEEHCRSVLEGHPRRDYGDAFAVGVPTGWAIARIGCFLAHDHPWVVHLKATPKRPEDPPPRLKNPGVLQ